MTSQSIKQKLLELNLLFVEDNVSVSSMSYDLLHGFFNNMYLAGNIQSAMDIYLEKKIDIIMTDIRMPNGTGLQLIKKIRESDTGIKIIILSAFNDFEIINESIVLDVDAYLIKPLNFLDLDKAFQKIVEKV